VLVAVGAERGVGEALGLRTEPPAPIARGLPGRGGARPEGQRRRAAGAGS
jgi:hypothetical protein